MKMSQSQNIQDEGTVTRKVEYESQTTVTMPQLVTGAIVSHNGNESSTLCGEDEVDQAAMSQNHEELHGARYNVVYIDPPKKLHEVSSELGDASGELVFHASPDQRDVKQVTNNASNAPRRPDPKNASPAFFENRKVTMDFLDSLRCEESQENEARKIAKKERCMIIKFSKIIQTAITELNAAEKGLEVLYNAKSISIPGLSEEVRNREQHMEVILARASAQVASLLAVNYADKFDCKAATIPIIALTKSIKSIIDDGGVVSSSLYENARKSFIDDLRGLCDATKDICEAARSNREKLNNAAILFGERSAKLLGVVSSDVNPTLETELISQTKAINETTSRLALEATNVTSNTCNREGDSRVQDICTAGARCVDAADKLVYTAMLIAPTINNYTCQDALVSSADSLSSSLTTFSNTWKALVSTQGLNVLKLTEEAGTLQALVEKLRNDIIKIGKLAAVGTPLRQMVACKVDEEVEVSSRAATSDLEPLCQAQAYSAREACSKAVPEEVNNQSLTKSAIDEAPRDSDYLQTNVMKPVNEVMHKEVYLPLDTEPCEAVPEETAKENTYLGRLMAGVNNNTRPHYTLLAKKIVRDQIEILDERDVDNLLLCERPEVEGTLRLKSADRLEVSTVHPKEQKKINVQEQFDTASKWLLKSTSKVEVKTHGQHAVHNIIYIANKITEDLKGHDKLYMRRLITETEQMLTECSKKYDLKRYNVMMELVRELKKGIERGVVTRIVEDFMEAEAPLADLDILADDERDERQHMFLLEKKITELLAHLSRVTKTARLIADTDTSATVSTQLITCSEQANSLASMLMKAAQQRVATPDDKVMIEECKYLLERYAESLSKIRNLCDQSVDAMDFVQTAGVKMQRMREESTNHNDLMKWEQTSTAIAKLGYRVIHVGLSSSTAHSDPELQKALLEVQQQMTAATPPAGTYSLLDWKQITGQILQATEEVESLLCGECIFKKQPEPNQPIHNEARNLHEAIRNWSSRDNEIVAVAKRMAVLMAKLSNYMYNGKKHEVQTTSRSLVTESHEVARLAKKLAHECSDHRIKSNLLQVCEKIPTISGQLKKLITVKTSSFGRHGIREDKNAMDMLVRNARSLMLSIQRVVKGAESASVKLKSQRGFRMKWVRKTSH